MIRPAFLTSNLVSEILGIGMKNSKGTAKWTRGRSTIARVTNNTKINMALKQKAVGVTFRRFNSSRGK